MIFMAVVVFFLAAEPAAKPSPHAPSFTNADLDRLAPRRGEGGVFVTGAPAAPAPADKPPLRGASAEQGEEYWRREADKVRDRVRPLRERAELLRARIDERQRKPGVRPYSDPGVLALQRDLARVLEQARELEERLEDRARRARALPGWLR
jgi:hypothetical protein